MEQSSYALPQDIHKAYILIAISDREESSRIHEALCQAGFSLFSFAFSGESALAWAKRVRPNLQILSSQYSDMKGLDLYGLLSQVTPGPPVPTLFLGKRQLHIETESGHRIVCLETPYTPEQLPKGIETLLHHIGRASAGSDERSPIA